MLLCYYKTDDFNYYMYNCLINRYFFLWNSVFNIQLYFKKEHTFFFLNISINQFMDFRTNFYSSPSKYINTTT